MYSVRSSVSKQCKSWFICECNVEAANDHVFVNCIRIKTSSAKILIVQCTSKGLLMKSQRLRLNLKYLIF